MKLLKEYKAAEFSGAARLWGNSQGYVITSPEESHRAQLRLCAERAFRQACDKLRRERDELVVAFYDTYRGTGDAFDALFQCPELIEEMNRRDMTPREMVEQLRKGLGK